MISFMRNGNPVTQSRKSFSCIKWWYLLLPCFNLFLMRLKCHALQGNSLFAFWYLLVQLSSIVILDWCWIIWRKCRQGEVCAPFSVISGWTEMSKCCLLLPPQEREAGGEWRKCCLSLLDFSLKPGEQKAVSHSLPLPSRTTDTSIDSPVVFVFLPTPKFDLWYYIDQ